VNQLLVTLGGFSLSGWDVLLILAVSVHATALAYVPKPRWKAFLLTLPVPFTLASLSLGRPVGASNVLGLLLLFAYTYGVYALRARLRVPIVPAIILCAGGYCLLASLLAPWIPATGTAFWVAAGIVVVMGVLLSRVLPHREEPSHRSPLPVYVKLPLVALVILMLVIIKQHLQGFMTLFPMVGVVASYEGRYCLWTLTRQIPIIMMTLLPMMAVMRLVYPLGGIGWALAAGWAVFIVVLVVLTRRQWAEETLEAALN
jgi:hypothetical protein